MSTLLLRSSSVSRLKLFHFDCSKAIRRVLYFPLHLPICWFSQLARRKIIELFLFISLWYDLNHKTCHVKWRKWKARNRSKEEPEQGFLMMSYFLSWEFFLFPAFFFLCSAGSPKSSARSTPVKWFYFVLFGGFVGFAVKVFPHAVLRDTVQSILQKHEPDGSKTKVSAHLVRKMLKSKRTVS